MWLLVARRVKASKGKVEVVGTATIKVDRHRATSFFSLRPLLILDYLALLALGIDIALYPNLDVKTAARRTLASRISHFAQHSPFSPTPRLPPSLVPTSNMSATGTASPAPSAALIPHATDSKT